MDTGWEKLSSQEVSCGKASQIESETATVNASKNLAMVPEGWTDATLGDLVKLKRGYDLPAQDRVVDGDIQIIGGGGPNGFHNVAKAPAPGVVIGGSGAGIDKAWWSDKPFSPLNTGLYVTDFQANDPRFCFLLLDWIDFHSYNTGGAQPSLNRNFIYPIQIPLPPLPEQRKIAEILGTWDRAISLTSALLDASRTRKRGLMQILLAGKRRFPEFEGQAWREVRLGEVVSGKKTKGKIVPTNDNGAGVPYIGTTAFEGKFLSFTEAGTIVSCKPEDLLVLWDGENAGASAFGLRGAVSSTVMRFQLDEKRVIAPFIAELMQLYNSEVRAIREGSGIPHMPKHFETWFKLLLPSVNEQRRISDVLISQKDEIYALQKQIENLRLQKKVLMQKLLTGEWRVKVDA